MLLKTLEIHGFKSFADKTKFNFDRGVTGVVGPNGCGKSNVIDAVRWALGEQKTRNLRSEKMENIIFNGTIKRKKANFADVSITFENNKGLLPEEYPTVTITRRLYRDGHSEYFLNQVACRLKDIYSLLLDTGVGSDSYAIIELKMIDELLNDKQGSRRQLFEEAAGISRYKTRKKETLARLDDTDASLERLEDVIFEVEKSMKRLEKQAKKAEKFFELKTAYKESSARLAFLKSGSIEQRIEAYKKEYSEWEDKIAAAEARAAKHEARAAELKRENADKETSLADAQQTFARHNEAIRKRENERKVREEQRKYLEQRAADVEGQIRAGAQKIEDYNSRLAQLEADIDSANEKYDKKEFLLVELETELEELQLTVKNRRVQVEELRDKIKSREKTQANQQKSYDQRAVQIEGLQKELQRSVEQRANAEAEVAQFNEKLERLRKEIAEEETRRDRLAAERARIEQEAAEVETLIQNANEQLQETARLLDRKTHERGLLKNMIDSLEGYPESVVYLKKKTDWAKKLPLVSDVFNCPVEYKPALESYLESYLNYYVADTREQAKNAIHLLKEKAKGRVNFFILEELKTWARQNRPAPEAPKGEVVALFPLLEYEEPHKPLAQYLLDHVYIWPEESFYPFVVPEGAAVLIQNGDWFAKLGAAGGGSVGLFTGKRIGRAQELENLKRDVKSLTVQFERQQEKLEQLKQRHAELVASNPKQELKSSAQRVADLEKEISIIQTKAEQFQNNVTNIEEREQEIVRQIEELNEFRAELEPGLEELQDELNAMYQQLSVQQQELSARSEAYGEVNKKLNDQNLAFLDVKNQIDNLKKDFRSYYAQIQEIEQNRGGLEKEVADCQIQMKTLAEADTGDEAELVRMYEEKARQEKSLQGLNEQLAEARNAIQQNETFSRQERKNKEEFQTKQTELKDAITERRIELNSLRERLSVEWQLNLDNLKEAELFGEKKVPALEDAKKETMKLREKYNKFGEVNTTAIESYNEIKERFDFLNAQRQDLLDARANLLQTIEEIDAAAREQFMEAFTKIRENFVKVFRTLFTEEDSCELKLANPDEPLESPVEIMARPKGKRPLTINQLSGGEKTLTAISLLFAIYLLKPAPFCIFDEVDAPLDDANIDKFNNIIREFSAESQFIIVTHNKRTMAKTNVMYGVTMEETGVSRVLPVDWTALNLN